METKDKERLKKLLNSPEYHGVREVIDAGEWDKLWDNLFNMPGAKDLTNEPTRWHEYWPAMFMTMFAELGIDCGLKEIPGYAFTSSSIEYIKIPEGVTSIGKKAFEFCNQLSDIEIPRSVTKIGYDAFYIPVDAVKNTASKVLRNIILPERFNDRETLRNIGIKEDIDRLRFI